MVPLSRPGDHFQSEEGVTFVREEGGHFPSEFPVKAKYTFVPSIAIFVEDAQAAAKLTDELLSFETLQDEGIDVADCSRGDTLSSRDTVRIFPIALVKGMEFEVAFFHNIDTLKSELVERYLYVGLSRAAFFLGVTSSSNNGLLESVRDLFSDGNWRQI